MRVNRLAVALTVVNVVLLLLVLAHGAATARPVVSPLLRIRALELVDDSGRVRAQLNAESSGEVVLRLRDASGTIRVKLGASEAGSGLVLLDGSTEPGVHILAGRSGTSYPATINAALTILGRPCGHTRKPIQPLDADALKRLERELEALGMLRDEPHGW
jgi:hypothetical protein